MSLSSALKVQQMLNSALLSTDVSKTPYDDSVHTGNKRQKTRDHCIEVNMEVSVEGETKEAERLACNYVVCCQERRVYKFNIFLESLDCTCALFAGLEHFVSVIFISLTHCLISLGRPL